MSASAPLRYSAASGLNEAPGYYFSLSAPQKGALAELLDGLSLEELRRVDAQVLEPAETRETYCLRFLRARDFHTKHAKAMLLKDLAWREEEGISDLAAKNISEVLQCSEESAQAVVEMFPSFVYGHDKDGQSLMFRHYGKFEIWKILEHTTLDNLLRLHVWENEQALQGMRQFARDSGNSIETFCAVVDAEGWRLGLATSDAMRYIKGMVNVDSDHYPERLGRMILINLPSMLLTVWSVIKRWLPPRTQDKIQLLGSRKDWEPVLRRYIDDKYIPEIYGGTGPNNEHEALERMHGKIGDASDAHGLHGGREEEEKTPLEASPDLSKKPPRDEQSCTQGSEPNEQPTESKWFHMEAEECLAKSKSEKGAVPA